EEVIRQRNAAIAEKDQRFGTGPFYTLGPAPDLIGEPAPPFTAGGAPATIDKAEMWDNYRPGQTPVPIFVNGTIGTGQAGDLIAVGVNGKIRGTARSFDFEGSQRFGTLVDPKSLVPGRNEITVYRVDNNGGLVPLGSN
ncbi:MAG: hypothetical protein M3Y23_05125, partial [Actinomycetota bacterium]|nr:hypothetical protein [Actinomycetota bacterium]